MDLQAAKALIHLKTLINTFQVSGTRYQGQNACVPLPQSNSYDES